MDDVTRLRELLAKATPAKWHHCCASGSGCGGLTAWTDESAERGIHYTSMDDSVADKEHGKDLIALAVAAVNALPALLDEVEAVRTVTDGNLWVGRWNVYQNGAGWTAVIPSEGFLRDTDGNVRRFPTLPAALVAIRGIK